MATTKYLTLTNLPTIFTESKKYVDKKVSDLVASAPETLDTLNELATALGNDANFATTISTQIGQKANSADVYTKTEADAAFISTEALTTALEPYAKTADMETALGGKANSADVYTKTQADGKFATPASVTTALEPYATTADMTTKLAAKANSADVYTKTTADSTFIKKADFVEATAKEITDAATTVFGA